MTDQEFIGPKDLLESATGLIVALHSCVDELEKLRTEDLLTRSAAKVGDDMLADARTMATLEIGVYLGNLVDPNTGKSNKDYTALHIEKELASHGQYQAAKVGWFSAHAKADAATNAYKSCADRFTAIRNASNLTAAMLYYLAERPAIVVASDEKEETNAD